MDDQDHRLDVMAKVARYLQEVDAPQLALSRNRVTAEEFITFRHDWAKVFVACRTRGEWTIVDVSVPLLGEVRASPELYRYVATADSYLFGHLVVREGGHGGTVTVSLIHALLGDYLDREELIMSVESMVHATTEFEGELRSRFGGRRFEWDSP